MRIFSNIQAAAELLRGGQMNECEISESGVVLIKKTRSRFLAIAIVTITILANVHPLLGQDPAELPKPACTFAEVRLESGWVIPALDGVDVETKRSHLGDYPGVFVTILRPKHPESSLNEVWCSPRNPGRLELKETPIDVLTLWKFDYEGKVFAYGISYGVEALQNGTRIKLGSARSLVFYDIDGSGRFTIRRSDVFPFRFVEVPDWARQKPPTEAVRSK
jgi:hypothetical protein